MLSNTYLLIPSSSPLSSWPKLGEGMITRAATTGGSGCNPSTSLASPFSMELGALHPRKTAKYSSRCSGIIGIIGIIGPSPPLLCTWSAALARHTHKVRLFYQII